MSQSNNVLIVQKEEQSMNESLPDSILDQSSNGCGCMMRFARKQKNLQVNLGAPGLDFIYTIWVAGVWILSAHMFAVVFIGRPHYESYGTLRTITFQSKIVPRCARTILKKFLRKMICT